MAQLKHGDLTIDYDDKVFTEGDLCKVFPCTITSPPTATKSSAVKTIFDRLLEDDTDGTGKHTDLAVLKLATVTFDNDMVAAEASFLKMIEAVPPNIDTKDKFASKYFPHLIDTVTIRSRAGNIIARLTGYVSMAEVHAAYPAGVDYRDLAWMLKRVLEGLGYAHNAGHIHGAIIPQHIMLDLANHGAKLIDWCYSVPMAQKRSIPAYVSSAKPFYAPEIFLKRLPTPATDLYMLAKCCVHMLGGDVGTNGLPASVPTEFADVLRKCLQESPSARPNSAWELHDEITKTLEKLVGKPTFRPFTMPAPV